MLCWLVNLFDHQSNHNLYNLHVKWYEYAHSTMHCDEPKPCKNTAGLKATQNLPELSSITETLYSEQYLIQYNRLFVNNTKV